MKKRLVFGILGKFMLIEAVLLLLPALVALIYHEYDNTICFLITAAISLSIGILLNLQNSKSSDLYAKEGLMIIGLVWICWSLIGALPFYMSKEIPRYIDAFFETVSGFTTTGSSILADVESLSYSMHFWRAFTHWIGGMGVLIFAMAIMPVSDKNAIHLMRAEVPGPTVSKLVPRGMKNAKILYGIYIGLCILEFIFLVIGGMPVFDSIIHTFSTAGTGGFSCKNASVLAYNSPYAEWVITVFMFLFSVNFNMFYFILIGKFLQIFKNTELKVFLGIVFAAVICLFFAARGSFETSGDALRTAAFQTMAIISTTGFGIGDFELWGGFAKTIILILMLMGACAGSTGGGLKLSRIIIMVKSAFKTLKTLISPHSVGNVKLDGRPLDDDIVKSVSGYMVIYILVIGLSLFLIAFNNLPFEETFSAVTTCISNVGPGFGSIGPVGNFSELSDFSKIILSFDMLLGRLEMFPILLLFSPSIWKRKFI